MGVYGWRPLLYDSEMGVYGWRPLLYDREMGDVLMWRLSIPKRIQNDAMLTNTLHVTVKQANIDFGACHQLLKTYLFDSCLSL